MQDKQNHEIIMLHPAYPAACDPAYLVCFYQGNLNEIWKISRNPAVFRVLQLPPPGLRSTWAKLFRALRGCEKIEMHADFPELFCIF